MAAIILPDKWRRQPANPQIACGGDIADGLFDCFVPSSGNVNLARSASLDASVISPGSSHKLLGGLAYQFDGNRKLSFAAGDAGDLGYTIAFGWCQNGASGKIYPTILRSNSNVVYLKDAGSFINLYRGYSGAGGYWHITSPKYLGTSLEPTICVISHQDGQTPNFYLDGVQVTSVTTDVAPSGSLVAETGTVSFGELSGAPWGTINGSVYFLYRWRRALSAPESIAISENPHQIFRKQPRILYFTAPSGGGATIAGDSGTYALTGSDVSLKVGRKLAAGSGTYILTGTAAALRVGRKLAAASGSYSLSGTDAAFKRGYALSASSGTYTVSGTAVSLKAGRKLAADSGIYTLTGTAASLTYAPTGSYTLNAESGSYTLTGTAATLRVSRKLTADSGTYALTGTAAGLAKGIKLTAESGSYTLTGSNVAFARTYVLTAESGAYTLTGTSAGLTWSGAPVVEVPTNGGPSIYGKPVFREKQFRKEYEEQVKRIEDEKRLARILREDEEITVIMALMAA